MNDYDEIYSLARLVAMGQQKAKRNSAHVFKQMPSEDPFGSIFENLNAAKGIYNLGNLLYKGGAALYESWPAIVAAFETYGPEVAAVAATA